MANIPLGVIGINAETSTECNIADMSVDIDIKNKDDDATLEEYRWILSVTLTAEHSNVYQAGPVGTSIFTQTRLEGTMNGSEDIAIDITGDFLDGNRTGFYLIHNSLQSVEARGSKFALETQRYTAISNYTDAPWNEV